MKVNGIRQWTTGHIPYVCGDVDPMSGEKLVMKISGYYRIKGRKKFPFKVDSLAKSVLEVGLQESRTTHWCELSFCREPLQEYLFQQ